MNKPNPDMEPGQSISPVRTKGDRTIESYRLEETLRISKSNC